MAGYNYNNINDTLERRRNLDYLLGQMRIERSSFYTHWRDLADNIAPTRPRFLASNANRGERKNQKIIDSTGALAARTLRSGMMAGITSPARPWFRLATPHQQLNEVPAIKFWLDGVGNEMSSVFLKSNLYNVLPTIYGDMGVFGTGCLFMEEDYDSVVRFYALPIGSYYLANDDKLQVKVFAREFRMTVRQMLQKFGKTQNGDPIEYVNGQIKIDWTNFSSHVKNLYEEGNLEAWMDICHVVQPNMYYDPNKSDSAFKKYSSVYFEGGGGSSTLNRQNLGIERNKFLRDAGYDHFPVLAPRWETTGEDVYATNCPGMESLGDIRQLQLGEKRIMQAVDKILNPPMQGPSSLKNKKASILPGDITFVDVQQGQQGFAPTYQVNPGIFEIENKQEQIRKRVSRVFYEDLFLMMAQSDRREITATEIEERHEEKMLALGPVLESLNQDLLDPLIDNTFDIMLKQGKIPPPPEELQGQELKVEYISIMAQAQKVIGIGGIERLSGFVSNLAAVDPSVLDKIDFDQLVDVYGEMTSVPPSIIRSDEDVDKIRQQKAQAQAEQAKMEKMQAMAGAAKDVGNPDTDQLGKNLELVANAGALVEGV